MFFDPYQIEALPPEKLFQYNFFLKLKFRKLPKLEIFENWRSLGDKIIFLVFQPRVVIN